MGRRGKFTDEVRERSVRMVLESAGGARPPTQVMVDFIEEHRSVYGVEPICEVLPIAPARTTRSAHVVEIRHGELHVPFATNS